MLTAKALDHVKSRVLVATVYGEDQFAAAHRSESHEGKQALTVYLFITASDPHLGGEALEIACQRPRRTRVHTVLRQNGPSVFLHVDTAFPLSDAKIAAMRLLTIFPSCGGIMQSDGEFEIFERKQFFIVWA
jgi:hypothetical protein